MSQHTPGPWHVDAEHAGLFEQDQARFWINASGTHVAYVDGPRNEERTANTRLIAAAPDLLEALRDMVAGDAEAIEEAKALGVPFPDEMLASYRRAVAVIAKAAGEQT